MKNQPRSTFNWIFVRTIFPVLLLFAMIKPVGAQTIQVPIPIPVGVRADLGESRLHSLVADVDIPRHGIYRLRAKTWINSGDAQRNESFFVDFRDSEGAAIHPGDSNAGIHKVIPDVPGPAQYIWRDGGTFSLPAGRCSLWMHHYAVISDAYPDFLAGPITGPESIRLVDSLQMIYIPSASSDPYPILFTKSDSFRVHGTDTTFYAKPGDSLRYQVGVYNLGPETASAVFLKNLPPKWFLIDSLSISPDQVINDSLFYQWSTLAQFDIRLITYWGRVRPDISQTDTLLINSLWVGADNDGKLDNNFRSDTLHVYFIELPPVNQAPVARDDSFTTPFETVVSGNVLLNDTDPDGDALTVNPVPVVAPAHGTLVLTGDGAFTYTPAPGYSGSDWFHYSVCDNGTPALCDTAVVTITVQQAPPPVNQAPVAQDDSFTTPFETVVSGNVLLNDTDPDGDPLTVATTPVIAPAHGTLVLTGDGAFTYTPAPGYSGSDAFHYSVCDNGTPALCDTAVVTITIEPPEAERLADIAAFIHVRSDSFQVVGVDTLFYAHPGDTLIYQIGIRNLGPKMADEPFLKNLPPSWFQVDTILVAPKSTNLDTLFYSWDALAPANSQIITYRGRVHMLLPDTVSLLINSLWSGALNDTILTNNTLRDTVYLIIPEQPPQPEPYLDATPSIVQVGKPIHVNVSVSGPVLSWDLWVYLANGEIDSTYADEYIAKTVLAPSEIYTVEPIYDGTQLYTGAKQEYIKFEMRIRDTFYNLRTAEDQVMVVDENNLVLDRNSFIPREEDPMEIRFRLSSNRVAELDVYDVAGRHITRLANQFFNAGWNAYVWNGLTESGTMVGSGVYIVTLRSGEYKDWKKFMIVR